MSIEPCSESDSRAMKMVQTQWVLLIIAICFLCCLFDRKDRDTGIIAVPVLDSGKSDG